MNFYNKQLLRTILRKIYKRNFNDKQLEQIYNNVINNRLITDISKDDNNQKDIEGDRQWKK